MVHLHPFIHPLRLSRIRDARQQVPSELGRSASTPRGGRTYFANRWDFSTHFASLDPSGHAAPSPPNASSRDRSSVKWVERSETKKARIDGRSLGNGTAFSAVAPSQRPACDAHQSKIFGSGIPIVSPRARISGRLTSSRLVSSARTAAFY
jgi:hypothetical protein